MISEISNRSKLWKLNEFHFWKAPCCLLSIKYNSSWIIAKLRATSVVGAVFEGSLRKMESCMPGSNTWGKFCFVGITRGRMTKWKWGGDGPLLRGGSSSFHYQCVSRRKLRSAGKNSQTLLTRTWYRECAG
jgi:hypothetical protein